MSPLQLKLTICGIIASALTGGVAGTIISNHLTAKRERIGRLRAFRSYIRSVLSEFKTIDLKTIEEGQLSSRHRAAVQGVRTECAKVFEDIPAKTRDAFEIVWLAYCGENVEPYDYYDPVTSPRAILQPNYTRGFERATTLLNEMIKYAR